MSNFQNTKRTIRMYTFHRHSDDVEISVTGATYNGFLAIIRLLGNSGDIRDDEEVVIAYYNAETKRTCADMWRITTNL